MPLLKLFWLFKEATTFVRPEDEALRQAGVEAPKHSSYHRLIVIVTIVTTLIGAGMGTYAALFDPEFENPEPEDRRVKFLMPFLSAATGMLFGFTLCCGLAPRSFLQGPLGRRWMRVIGTPDVATARVICLFLALLIGGIGALLLLLTLGILAPPGRR